MLVEYLTEGDHEGVDIVSQNLYLFAALELRNMTEQLMCEAPGKDWTIP